MRSLYKRHIKITLLSESEKDQAHGWFTTRNRDDQEVVHYFKGEQARFIETIKREKIIGLKLALEKIGYTPTSITIQYSHNTFTFKNLSRAPLDPFEQVTQPLYVVRAMQ